MNSKPMLIKDAALYSSDPVRQALAQRIMSGDPEIMSKISTGGYEPKEWTQKDKDELYAVLNSYPLCQAVTPVKVEWSQADKNRLDTALEDCLGYKPDTHPHD